MSKLNVDTDIGGDIDDLCALAMVLNWPKSGVDRHYDGARGSRQASRLRPLHAPNCWVPWSARRGWRRHFMRYIPALAARIPPC
jgi:hypothetical protein